jgi:uncharacterized protein
MDRVTFSTTASLDGNTLEGVAHAFGQRAKHGSGYVEFAPGAFTKALRKADVRAFVNHDTTLLLGRQKSGTVRVSAQPDGLHYAIDLPDTTYAADLKVLIARGDLTEMSFGILPGAVKIRKADDGRQVVYHTEVEELFDISPTAMPAFGGTSIALHSSRNTESTRSQLTRARHRVTTA